MTKLAQLTEQNAIDGIDIIVQDGGIAKRMPLNAVMAVLLAELNKPVVLFESENGVSSGTVTLANQDVYRYYIVAVGGSRHENIVTLSQLKKLLGQRYYAGDYGSGYCGFEFTITDDKLVSLSNFNTTSSLRDIKGIK